MVENHQQQKHANRGPPPGGLRWVECANQEREKLVNDGDMGPVIWGFKAGQYPRWKEKSQGQYGTVMPIARAIESQQ
jgi:hypothetical protein